MNIMTTTYRTIDHYTIVRHKGSKGGAYKRYPDERFEFFSDAIKRAAERQESEHPKNDRGFYDYTFQVRPVY